jgi:gliding motility-associated-like protein
LEMPYVSDENTSYFWEIDGQIYTNPIEDVVLTIPGSYDVTLFATALNGCGNSFSLDAAFDVYGYPEARFDFNEEGLSSLLTEAYFTNLSTDNQLNYWDFGDGVTSNEEEPVHTYPNVEDAAYRACLRVENEFGCEDEHCEEFYIEGEFLVYVPNAFTPDMDGINDVFMPIVRGIEIDEYSFKIFNRWGEQIFASITPFEGWVGNVQNGVYFAQNEIYTWVLEVKDLYTAEIHTVQGHVNLLR